MGVYYKVVCDARRESLNPGWIDNSGIKFGAITHPDHRLGQVLLLVMGSSWYGHSARLVADESWADADVDAYQNYMDITRQVVDDWNDYHRPSGSTSTVQIKYTGPESGREEDD